jgi:ATP-dependent DNA ligase
LIWTGHFITLIYKRGEIGPDLFRAACRMGLEGVVSKHRERPYQAGQSKHWVKVKNRTHPAMYRVMDALVWRVPHLWTPRFEEDRHVVGCCHLSGL